jgi:hypothetical protein
MGGEHGSGNARAATGEGHRNRRAREIPREVATARVAKTGRRLARWRTRPQNRKTVLRPHDDYHNDRLAGACPDVPLDVQAAPIINWEIGN